MSLIWLVEGHIQIKILKLKICVLEFLVNSHDEKISTLFYLSL